MTGFMRDDEPRTWEAVRRPSGLWVAGRDWLDRHDPRPATPSGDVYATTERAWQPSDDLRPVPIVPTPWVHTTTPGGAA